MASTNFVDKTTVIQAAWLNEVDALVHDVFNALSSAGADGTFLVSDGTNYVEESGATARTSLGVSIGSDVQAHSADLDTYASNPLAATELAELQNIGATTISPTQWGYLGGLASAPLEDNDLAANGGTVVQDDEIREVLSADRTYYVDASSGSDSNDGLSSGNAFATIQHAFDVISLLDSGIYTVTLELADGAYNSNAEFEGMVGNGSLRIIGNTATPSNVLWSVTGANCLTASKVAKISLVNGIEFGTTTSGHCIYAEGSSVQISLGGDVIFGDCAQDHLRADAGSTINQGGYEITGNASRHIITQNGGKIISDGKTITLTGTPDFTVFALSAGVSIVSQFNMTYDGSATGKRYDVSGNSVINSFGGGSSFFPGDAAGTESDGGVYI